MPCKPCQLAIDQSHAPVLTFLSFLLLVYILGKIRKKI